MNNNLKELIGIMELRFKRLQEINEKISVHPKSIAVEEKQFMKAFDQTITILKTLSESSKIVPGEKAIPSCFGIPDEISKDMGHNALRAIVLTNVAAFKLRLLGVIANILPNAVLVKSNPEQISKLVNKLAKKIWSEM